MRNPLEPQATTSRHRSRLASESCSATPSSRPSSTSWPLRSSSIKARRIGARPVKTPWKARASRLGLVRRGEHRSTARVRLLRLDLQDAAAVLSGPVGGILLLGVSLGTRAVLRRGPDRWAQRGVDHAAAVDPLAGATGARAAVARHPLCRGAAGLAHGAVRADDPPAGRRRRAPRSLRPPAVQDPAALRARVRPVVPPRARPVRVEACRVAVVSGLPSAPQN